MPDKEKCQGKKTKISKKSYGVSLDSSMDCMEETRFKKKYQNLTKRLSNTLHFDYTEIECLLLIYYKLSKDNNLSKSLLRDILHSSLDMTDDYLMDRIFLNICKGRSTSITMETWASMLSLFLRGTLEEKIDYCFSVYDVMGEGLLEKETMLFLLKHSLVGQNTDDDFEEIRDMIDIITKKMDIDRDGKISFSDYKTTVMKDPMLLEAFGQCLPSREAVLAFLVTFSKNIIKQ